jgi:hypothetical protein
MMTQRRIAQWIFLGIITLFAENYSKQWTWLFTKKFSAPEIAGNKKRDSLVFSKLNVPLFNQLIFSWNAFKPTQGHFSFYTQVRDAKTHKWHEWHKMVDWGNTIQQSYFSTGPVTKYCHVRLEVPHHKLADALRIKIISSSNADLSLLKALAVTLSDFTKFELIPPQTNLPSIEIQGIPQQSQMILDHLRAEHMCSPTSCSMLVSYLSKSTICPLNFAQNVYDKGLDSYGSWPFNTVHAYEQCKGKIFFHVTRLNSFADLYAKLKQSIPVVVSVRGPLAGAPREFKNGHLIVVIGWDQQSKKVICHDPAFDSNDKVTTRYDLDSFCQAWARSHHLAYLAEIA